MTQQLPAPTPRSFRAFTNVVAFLAILLAIDWGLSWWRGTPTYACSGALTLVSDSGLALVGMGGLLIAIVGVAFGGAKHWITLLGISLLVFGLLGLVVLSEPIQAVCG
jgi:hypothetical protein